MSTSTQGELQAVIDAHPISGLQRIVFILCFLIVAVDGIDTTVIGFLAPAISGDWGTAPAAFAGVFGAGVVGAMLGAFIFGPVADRIGRKKTLIVTIIIFSVGCLASGWANSISELTALRLVSGLGLGGALPCATALVSEFSPTHRRSTLVTALFCGFSLGAAAGGLIAGVVTPEFGWRAVLIAGGVTPLLLVPVVWRMLPESVNFLVAKGSDPEQVRRILARIAPDAKLEDVPTVQSQERPRGVVRELFRVRPVIGTLMLWCTAFLALLAIGLLSSWMPIFLSGRGYSLTAASLITLMFQLGAATGAIVLGRLMDLMAPHRVLAVAFVFASGFTGIVGVVTASPVLAGMTIFLSGFFLVGAQYGLWAYAAGYYPTRVRATGVSWTNASGRAGAIAGSFLGGGLLALGLGVSEIMALLALPAIGAAVLMFFHPGQVLQTAPSK